MIIVVLFNTMSATYTKAQKKQMRKDVYDSAKRYKKGMEDEYLPNPNGAARLEMMFPQAIMEADFNLSLAIHRKLLHLEKEILDVLVFDETDRFSSENVRVGCNNIKINNENRKRLLKMAMECDAQVGYWQLSK